MRGSTSPDDTGIRRREAGAEASRETAVLGAEAVGVLLTGMGRDGAAGLRRMRDRGAFTIAQDETSCAVYGMPAAAMAAGAVDRQLPLAEIGTAVRQLTGAGTPHDGSAGNESPADDAPQDQGAQR